MFRPAKAETRNGKAVGDAPENGQQVWVMTKGGAGGGSFWDTHGGEVEGDNGYCYAWQDVAMWIAAPVLERDEKGRLVVKDLPF